MKTPQTLPTSESGSIDQMFDSAPIPLWLEDYSDLKRLLDGWREQGVTDLAKHLRQHPELMRQCSASLKVLRVNQQTLSVYAARDHDDLTSRLGEVFRDDTYASMLVELVHLWNGNLAFSNQSVNYALDG